MSNFINPSTNTTPVLYSTAAAPVGTAPSRPGAPLMSGAPVLSNTGPLMPGATLMGTGDRHLSRKERKALKHDHGRGLTGTGMPLAAGVATNPSGLTNKTTKRKQDRNVRRWSNSRASRPRA
jgi:hypothetical protein